MRNIDLNTASRDDFMEIEGIGPTLADNIVRFREERGGVDSVDDLREGSGIDESTLEELRLAAGQGGESEELEEESEEW